jgi:polyhydroxyalkanoate synthase
MKNKSLQMKLSPLVEQFVVRRHLLIRSGLESKLIQIKALQCSNNIFKNGSRTMTKIQESAGTVVTMEKVPPEAGERSASATRYRPSASTAVATRPTAISSSPREHRPAAAADREVPPPLISALERDSYASTALSDVIDRSLTAAAARFTFGLSPAVLAEACSDWLVHLAVAPGKRMQLLEKALKKTARLALYSQAQALPDRPTRCIEPLPQDRRFDADAWQRWPYNIIYQAFLLQQQWWHNATTGVRGVSQEHERMLEFTARQILDMISPSNFLLTNPEFLQRTIEQGGTNLLRGAQNLFEDCGRFVSGKKPVGAEAFGVGRNLAITPGKVVYRNRLIELIQYAPSTDKVKPEPVLIVPAWIMKYYILDLSPENSLVKYLVEHGFTVFVISWKNPSPEDRELGMEDYHRLGTMAALDAISSIVPDQPVHAAGYCLGGTLLSITAAAMARDGDQRLRSVTLFTAQTDFTEAGELMLFINESQLAFLEDMMWEQGFLDTTQMGSSFQLLNSNDLIWSRLTREYLMGERDPMIDLMAWNADGTRLPYRMHSEYLRHLFLDNDLAEGRYRVEGKPIALNDIHVPIFAVGTARDHVAPWRSVHKIHLFTDAEITFVLTSGGHNGGVVAQPGRGHRSYQVMTRTSNGRYYDPDSWAAAAPRKEDSWWPEWVAWLEKRSGAPVKPPRIGAATYAPLCDAPGTYVLQA